MSNLRPPTKSYCWSWRRGLLGKG